MDRRPEVAEAAAVETRPAAGAKPLRRPAIRLLRRNQTPQGTPLTTMPHAGRPGGPDAPAEATGPILETTAAVTTMAMATTAVGLAASAGVQAVIRLAVLLEQQQQRRSS